MDLSASPLAGAGLVGFEFDQQTDDELELAQIGVFRLAQVRRLAMVWYQDGVAKGWRGLQ